MHLTMWIARGTPCFLDLNPRPYQLRDLCWQEYEGVDGKHGYLLQHCSIQCGEEHHYGNSNSPPCLEQTSS